MPTSETEQATKTNDICGGCGACCAPGILGIKTDPYLEITPEDLKDDFKSKQKLAVKDQMHGEGGKLFLPVVRGSNDFTQCEHLLGTVLESAACGCYDTRPTACRIFEPGGYQCQKVRQAWLVHRDKVMWEQVAHPEYSHDDAVYEVVASNSCLGLHPSNKRVLESLGAGPDYIHLRKERDYSQRLELDERKLSASPATSFREQHIAHEGKGVDPAAKKSARPGRAKAKSR